MFDPGGAWPAARGGAPGGGGADSRLAGGASVKQRREALQQQLHALTHLPQSGGLQTPDSTMAWQMQLEDEMATFRRAQVDGKVEAAWT